MRETESF